MQIILVAVGGAIGATLRYLIGRLATEFITLPIPVGTLIVNILGCFAMGLFAAGISDLQETSKETFILFIMVGVLGGFTTFSAFGFDTVSLWNKGAVSLALINIIANNTLSFIALALGYRLIKT